MSSQTIYVIGIGEDGVAGLSRQALHHIDTADVVVGGKRHLALVADFSGERIEWLSDLAATFKSLEARLSKRIVVLASGDPLYYGVAKRLIDHFGKDRIHVLPVPGAVDLTCAAMGWSQPDVNVVTVHGRPLESLHLYLVPGARLVVLSHDGKTPGHVATLLENAGYGASTLTVFEHLGGEFETRAEGQASLWQRHSMAALNTIAIDVIGEKNMRPLSRLAGLPDDAFEHDGQLTKRATRAVTLSSLAPLPGQVLWDFGAGAGSISIEWMRCHPSCHAVAVERDAVRAARILTNAKKLGVPTLQIIVGENLDILKTLPGAPDAIFIGGGICHPGLVKTAWSCLKPGGRLVANGVTDQSRNLLKDLCVKYGGELMEIAITGKRPITQYIGTKEHGG